MIENLDYNIGRIQKSLRDNNIAFDTHIIFFSDHGDMHGSHGQFRKTGHENIGVWGMRHKRFLKENHCVLSANLMTSGNLVAYLDDIEQ